MIFFGAMGMLTTYEFGKGEAFKKEYPNLFCRISNVQDMILSYCRSGELFTLYPYGMSATDVPKILRVTFDDKKARRYEQTMEKFSSSRLPSGEAELPKPKFSVELELDFCFGSIGKRTFDFCKWQDKQALKEFCAELKERRDEAYRRRLIRMI